jgi:hypothetical protein
MIPRGFQTSLKEMMHVDKLMTLEKDPLLKLENAKPVKNARGAIIPVVRYIPKTDGKSHLVAFLNADGAFVGVSMVSSSIKELGTAEASFRKFVGSIHRIRFDGEKEYDKGGILGTPPKFVVRQAILDRCLHRCDVRSQVHKLVGDPKSSAHRKACEKSCSTPESLDRALKAELPDDWGLSVKNAIETCTPIGTHDFLDDLLCKDGSKPAYRRIGQAGSRQKGPAIDINKVDIGNLDMIRVPPGQPDTHIVDKWEVKCGSKIHTLFFDVYHCLDPKPWAAPKGFKRPLRKKPYRKLQPPPAGK